MRTQYYISYFRKATPTKLFQIIYELNYFTENGILCIKIAGVIFMHRLISAGKHVFLPIDGSYENPLFDHLEVSKSQQLWIEMLKKEGIYTESNDVNVNTLFEYVKFGFESVLGYKPDAYFISQYIAANNGELAVKHDQASRAFTTGRLVYIDKLMVNVLLEYTANHYLWARFGNDVFPFCFKYTLKILDACCRQGYLNSDESLAELLIQFKEKGDAKAYHFIADLYWCIIAFIMCHELAHIYIDDISEKTNKPITDAEAETMADEYGYKVFLHLVEGMNSHTDSPYSTVFQDYLYAAPMILFLFYEDLYFMENWIYGERISLGEHSPFSSRLSRLLDLSREWDLQIDLTEGDAVLANYWDISDLFREELVYKLKNGKLTEVIQKGYCNMKNSSGYEQALQFDMSIQQQLKEYAISQEINPGKMIGLYNIAVKYDVLDNDVANHGLVHTVDGKVVSTKPYNLRFCLAASLSAIIDTGITLFTPGKAILTIMQLIKILVTILDESSIEISEEQAKILTECHRLNTSHSPVDEDQILATTGASHKVVDELCRLKCIELIEGKIKLVEEVVLN